MKGFTSSSSAENSCIISAWRISAILRYVKSENRALRNRFSIDRRERQTYDLLNENLKRKQVLPLRFLFYDNCTTRLRDLIRAYKRPRPHFETVMPEEHQVSEAIHMYLDGPAVLEQTGDRHPLGCARRCDHDR